MRNILVTGGAGFIGSHLCDKLLVENKRVFCVDNMNDYYDSNFKKQNISHNIGNPNFTFFEEDFRNYEIMDKIIYENKISIIVHLGAQAGVRFSFQNPDEYIDINVRGTLNILELSKKHKVEKLIFGSSSSVYGTNLEVPFSEKDQTFNMISPYAATKRMGEILCQTYSNIFGIKIACLRFFTVYGPRGRPDMAPYMFVRNILKKSPIRMFGDGSSARDYTFISDITDGIFATIITDFDFDIINLGNSKPTKLIDFISTIELVTDCKAKINIEEMPEGDVPFTYADISKAKELLNFEPKINIDEGISEFVKWYLDERY